MKDIIALSSQNFMNQFQPKSIHINGFNIAFDSCNWNEIRALKKNERWWTDIIEFLEEYTNGHNTVTLTTSGSTGKPKSLTVEKYKLYNSALKTVDYFKLNSASKGLLCLSANYIAGKMMLIRAMVSGMHLLCVEPKSNPITDLNERIDFAAMVPLQVKECLNNPFNFKNIKQLIIGGGAVDNKLIEALLKTKTKAYETFGMTETFSHIAVRQLTPNTAPFFTPLSGVHITQGNDDALIIDSPDIGAHKLQTNDIIALKPSNQFEWLGRKDFVINSGGIKLSPENIENRISSFLVQNFCITSIKNDKLGEKVVLVIEGNQFDTYELENKIKKNIQDYQQPKQVLFISEFPLTENGKLKRKDIQALIQ